MNTIHTCSLLLLSLSPSLVASPHGGSYRGPGDVKPPNSGGSSTPPPAAGPPANPAPGSSGPTTPTGATPTPGAGPAPGSAPRRLGIQICEDLSKWQYWWEFNKDDYLSLKDAVHAPTHVAGSAEMYLGAKRLATGRVATRPTRQDILNRILPALQRALTQIHNRDVTSACLIAMAKIGRDHPNFKILPQMRQRLRSRDQEIRETAALAMGLSHMTAAIPDLIALALDSGRGRKLTDRARVDLRSRAFAIYGLGLMAHANPDIHTQNTILKPLAGLLADPTVVDRNLLIATINAIGLLRPPLVDGKPGRSRNQAIALAALNAYFQRAKSPGEAVIRAHVAPSVARLIGRGDSVIARLWLDRLLTSLRSTEHQAAVLTRSAALALGQLAIPAEHLADHQRYSTGLLRYFRRGKDPQTRYFCLIALAQIGGANNRDELLDVLQQGRTLEQPWAALALGCLANQALRTDGTPDAKIARALQQAFARTIVPYAKGALAIGLGLTGHRPAGAELLQNLASHGHQDEMSGYLCIGLGLMQFDGATDAITKLLANSIRRPHRLRMAAVALGRLGDRRVSQRLIEQIGGNNLNLAKMAAVAGALAQIGDREAITPLCKILADDRLPEIARAFAVVALGGIADKESRPFNAKIAANLNYRAAVETLVQSGAGILDIL